MCLAVPGRILSVSGEEPAQRRAKVSFGGIVKEVSLACLPDAIPGDYVLVHVGLAIGKVDMEEAQKVFDYLRQMNELQELKNEPSERV